MVPEVMEYPEVMARETNREQDGNSRECQEEGNIRKCGKRSESGRRQKQPENSEDTRRKYPEMKELETNREQVE